MGLPDSESSPPGFARSLAIVIGIDDYAHGIPPLLNAVRDAHTVAETLRLQGFEILRLIDAEASLASLTHLFSHQLPSLHPPPDRLLIYFAGHGLAHTDPRLHLAGYLLPSDARRDEPSSYWPMAALHEALRQLPCGHLLLILDCCFAGAFPHSFSRDIRAPSPPAPSSSSASATSPPAAPSSSCSPPLTMSWPRTGSWRSPPRNRSAMASTRPSPWPSSRRFAPPLPPIPIGTGCSPPPSSTPSCATGFSNSFRPTPRRPRPCGIWTGTTGASSSSSSRTPSPRSPPPHRSPSTPTPTSACGPSPRPTATCFSGGSASSIPC
ncbi:caspase family protein [Cystobacter fuscus]